jgi:hypothetical protein
MCAPLHLGVTVRPTLLRRTSVYAVCVKGRAMVPWARGALRGSGRRRTRVRLRDLAEAVVIFLEELLCVLVESWGSGSGWCPTPMRCSCKWWLGLRWPSKAVYNALIAASRWPGAVDFNQPQVQGDACGWVPGELLHIEHATYRTLVHGAFRCA